MTIVGCSSCGARNRAGPVARGTPRRAKCKAALPWVVDAGEATFGREVDRVVGALPLQALEARLAPHLNGA